jgi:hypothetical protein
MGTNGFREDELITRRVNGQTRVFPVVGGRLRLAHEENASLSLQTEMVNWDGQYAVFKCRAVTVKGDYVGYGTANSQRDSRLAESLIELAETRSIARALRFAGYGLEFCGAEEIGHIPEGDLEPRRTVSKERAPVFPEGNGNGKPQTKAQNGPNFGDRSKASSDAIDPGTAGETKPSSGAAADNGSKPQSCGIGLATQAQCRALYALTKRAQYTQEDIDGMLTSTGAAAFQDLTREAASKLIGSLQAEVAA